MKKDWKYILYVATAFGLFVAVKLLAPKQYNWNITFSHQDKNPYGGYALNSLLGSLFNEGVAHSYMTTYEMKDSLGKKDNILIVSSGFTGAKEDSDVLLKHAAGGGHVFISAQYFWGHFADTLGVSTYDYFFKGADIFTKRDTSILKFANTALDTNDVYSYRRDNIHNYFNRFDTLRTTVIAENDRNLPVTIRIAYGKGDFILNSTPLIFTNIYLLSGENINFASKMLSCLPPAPLRWTEFYHVGRTEMSTPLRYILTNEPLAWAYYLALASLILFMVFEMKRRQRIIPVIKPVANSTLEFVETIGNLYYQRAEHKNIAEKKIHYLLDQIRTRYGMNVSQLDENFVRMLAAKTDKVAEQIAELVNTINRVQAKATISEEELIDLNRKIEKFNAA